MKRGLSGASGARRKHKTTDETGALLLGLDPLGPFRFPDPVVRMQHSGEECRDAATIWTTDPRRQCGANHGSANTGTSSCSVVRRLCLFAQAQSQKIHQFIFCNVSNLCFMFTVFFHVCRSLFLELFKTKRVFIIRLPCFMVVQSFVVVVALAFFWLWWLSLPLLVVVVVASFWWWWWSLLGSFGGYPCSFWWEWLPWLPLVMVVVPLASFVGVGGGGSPCVLLLVVGCHLLPFCWWWLPLPPYGGDCPGLHVVVDVASLVGGSSWSTILFCVVVVVFATNGGGGCPCLLCCLWWLLLPPLLFVVVALASPWAVSFGSGGGGKREEVEITPPAKEKGT